MNGPRTIAASPLDLSRSRGKIPGMKSLLALCALIASFIPAQADSIIRMVGTPSWKITPPACRFKVDGPIQNLSPVGTASGTLKLVLFISKAPYPSAGSQVSELELGQLAGQTQFNKAAGKSLAYVPKVTGTYYFSVLVAEYTLSGWRVRAYADTGKYKLKDGVFVTGTKWTVPKGPVLPPPGRLVNGDFIDFKEKATESFDMIAPMAQTRTRVQILKGKNCRVSTVGEQVKVTYSYGTGIVRSNGKRSDVGELTVDFSNLTDSIYQTESQYVLYFTTGLSGYYKRTDLAGTGRRVVWGLFSLNGGAFPQSTAIKTEPASIDLVSAWAATEPTDAAAWVAGMDSTEDRSATLLESVLGGASSRLDSFVESLSSSDPAFVAEWLKSIEADETDSCGGRDVEVEETTTE